MIENERSKRRRADLCWPAILLALAVVLGSFLGLSGTASSQVERETGHFTVVDEDGREIFVTAHWLAPGDVFIAADNRAYEVTSVEGDLARASFMQPMSLGSEGERPESRLGRAVSAALAALRGVVLGEQARGGGTVVLYNSHSDESYEPTSGRPTKDWGDVYKVAAALENALERHGFRVVRSTANHNPHDGGAYARSRRTLAELLTNRPVAAFDIHRDAVPPQAYRASVGGQDVTRITLVVGQQNQTRGQNIQFAKQLKAAADERTPGLVKGILWAQGSYNQDMLGRATLLEVGAHSNRLEEAERAVDLFAASIARVVAAAGPGVGSAPGGAGRAVAWIVGLVALGGGAYLAANAGAWRKIRARLSAIGARGLLNLLGLGRRKR